LEGCREELQKRLSGQQQECERIRDDAEKERLKYDHAVQLEKVSRGQVETELRIAQSDSKRKEGEVNLPFLDSSISPGFDEFQSN
jgi:hypothetical protein